MSNLVSIGYGARIPQSHAISADLLGRHSGKSVDMIVAETAGALDQGRTFKDPEDFFAAVLNVERGLLTPEQAVLAFTPPSNGNGVNNVVTVEFQNYSVNGNRPRWREHAAERRNILYGSPSGEIIYGEFIDTHTSPEPGRAIKRLDTQASQLMKNISSPDPNWNKARELYFDLQSAYRRNARLFGSPAFDRGFLHAVGSVILQETPVVANIRVDPTRTPRGYEIKQYNPGNGR